MAGVFLCDLSKASKLLEREQPREQPWVDSIFFIPNRIVTQTGGAVTHPTSTARSQS